MKGQEEVFSGVCWVEGDNMCWQGAPLCYKKYV